MEDPIFFQQVKSVIESGVFPDFVKVNDIDLISAHHSEIRMICRDAFKGGCIPSKYDVGLFLLLFYDSPKVFSACDNYADMREQFNIMNIKGVYRIKLASNCICGQDIGTTFMMQCNGRYLILGSVCITKNADMDALNTEYRGMIRITCDTCGLDKPKCFEVNDLDEEVTPNSCRLCYNRKVKSDAAARLRAITIEANRVDREAREALEAIEHAKNYKKCSSPGCTKQLYKMNYEGKPRAGWSEGWAKCFPCIEIIQKKKKHKQRLQT